MIELYLLITVSVVVILLAIILTAYAIRILTILIELYNVIHDIKNDNLDRLNNSSDDAIYNLQTIAHHVKR